ncbi:Surface antigen [Anaplasma phagocytophilum]|nr:Surface antigen [Anaplasma phagocytophilum]
MEISNSGIGKKVCVTKEGPRSKFGEYAEETKNDTTNGENKVAVCGGKAAKTAGDAGANGAQFLKDFVTATLKGDGSKNWPTSKGATQHVGTPAPKANDNAEAVAKDLVQELTPEEKTIVAGLLAKTIEGGEVVEIRAVSSTSVMVNACYDLLSEGLGVVPYAYVGLGGNFVGVVDGMYYTNHL